jgi:hypothetical protein
MAAAADANRPARAPKPVRLKGGHSLTIHDIEAAIGGGRE